MHTERDDSGQYSPIHANIACIGEPVSKDDSQLSFEADGPAFLTQDERAAMSDVSVRTQATSDIYEKAGLGPEIRSGAISGAEAERRARDPDAPKPPSQLTRSIPGLYDGPCGLTPRNTCCQENIDQVNIWATGSAGFGATQFWCGAGLHDVP